MLVSGLKWYNFGVPTSYGDEMTTGNFERSRRPSSSMFCIEGKAHFARISNKIRPSSNFNTGKLTHRTISSLKSGCRATYASPCFSTTSLTPPESGLRSLARYIKFAVPPESGVSDDTAYSVPSNSFRTESLIHSALFPIDMIQTPEILVPNCYSKKKKKEKEKKKLNGGVCEIERQW